MTEASREGAPARVRAIGEYVPLVDGPDKVSGRAHYTADLPAAGALAGRILRSPWGHAAIRSVDTSEAQALPGVRAVVTGADCDRTFGVLPIAMHEYPLARGRVRYRGEAIAAVAADDDATAARALALIRVEVEELPAYYTAEAALAPGAIDLHEKRPGNLERDVEFEIGDLDAALAGADLVREKTYRCAEVCQAQMEMHAALADYDPERGRLTVHASTQVPLLRPPHARALPRPGEVADPGGQASHRGRLRLPHRDPPRRDRLRPPRPQGGRGGAPRDHPRRDLPHPPGASRAVGASEARAPARRPHRRGRVRDRAARRRLFRLRDRHHPLLGLAPLRALPP